MKTISPIIATVILVVITVGAALFLWTFFQSYISSQTQNIPDLCLTTTDLKCTHNGTHIKSCIFSHKAGKNLVNISFFIVCTDPVATKEIFSERINLGNTTILTLDLMCRKDKTSIRVSGTCEDYTSAQVVYECDGLRCFI